MTNILTLKKELLKAKIHVHRQELKQQWNDNLINSDTNKIDEIQQVFSKEYLNSLTQKIISSPLLKSIPSAIFHEDARRFLWKYVSPTIKKYQKPMILSVIGICGIIAIRYWKNKTKNTDC